MSKPKGRPQTTGKYNSRFELERAVLHDYRTTTIQPKGLTAYYSAQAEKHGVSLYTLLLIIGQDGKINAPTI